MLGYSMSGVLANVVSALKELSDKVDALEARLAAG
jgi:hypothetical protein